MGVIDGGFPLDFIMIMEYKLNKLTKEKVNMTEYKLKSGDEVKFDLNGDGEIWEGEIVGTSSSLPVVGDVWMVKVTSGQIPNETYPFNTCSVFDCRILD